VTQAAVDPVQGIAALNRRRVGQRALRIRKRAAAAASRGRLLRRGLLRGRRLIGAEGDEAAAEQEGEGGGNQEFGAHQYLDSESEPQHLTSVSAPAAAFHQTKSAWRGSGRGYRCACGSGLRAAKRSGIIRLYFLWRRPW
jgi:hypothetical protein